MVHVRVEAPGVDEQLRLSLDRPVVIGRASDCHVVLEAFDVSRKHASLYLRDGSLWLRDHSSRGTLFDGEALHYAVRRLGPHAQIQVGPYSLTLHSDEPSPGPESLSQGKAAPPEQSTAVSEAKRMAALELRRGIRAALLESLDLASVERGRMTPELMRPRVLEALERLTAAVAHEFDEPVQRLTLVRELCDEALGLGPLEPLLADASISEVMVVDPSTIYVERKGRIELASARFTDETAVRAVLERIVTPLGRRIDESNPIVDARLSDGSRVNAVIPPLALRGPCITIRKFPEQRLTLARLVEYGSLSTDMAAFLERAVRVRANIVIAGGTGSGKTTLLNVLSAAIPAQERVVTIEDAAELSLAQPHVVALEARPANMEGAGAVTIRDLVKNALRMRPDRIVVGECRSGEALDMLQAMNTGHEGSMTTTHANSPSEAVHRLETLCLMAGLDLPLSAVRRQIVGSVDLLVQQARFADGSRRVTHVSEVLGVDPHGEVELRDIFRYRHTGTSAMGDVQGCFAATGYIPRCVERFLAAGIVEESACL
jgi:pilus assembly protein CpaF